MIIEVGLVRGNYSIFSVSDGGTEALWRGGGVGLGLTGIIG